MSYISQLVTMRTTCARIVAVLGFMLLGCSLHAGNATGTAFFVTPNGYAITCAHVVKDATGIRLSVGSRSLKAAIIATDEKNDVALLKVETTGQSVIPLSDSGKVDSGSKAWVLGYPLSSVLGDGVKVTSGTVSGITIQGTQQFIQMDAAVNPGNSGGPLLNDRGVVIGVVNAKIVDHEVSGVGFAVPINHAVRLCRDENVPYATTASAAALDGPELTRNAGPAVALVTVTIPLKEPVMVKSLPVGECMSASFSSDGKRLVCGGGGSNKATIWNVETGSPVRAFVGTVESDFKAEALNDNKRRLLKSMCVECRICS